MRSKLKTYIASPLGAPSQPEIERNMKGCSVYKKMAEAEFPIESMAYHDWLPAILDDNNPEDRSRALTETQKLLNSCSAIFMCGVRLSEGMKAEAHEAARNGIEVFCFSEAMKHALDMEQIECTMLDSMLLGASVSEASLFFNEEMAGERAENIKRYVG